MIEKKYPSSLIAIEKEIKVGELRKRFDILVYKDAKPWLIVECKEMNTPINEKVVQQIITYNISLQVPYLIITNGKETLGMIINDKGFTSIQSLPVH
jgi:predicted type IV restriction endonuclease